MCGCGGVDCSEIGEGSLFSVFGVGWEGDEEVEEFGFHAQNCICGAGDPAWVCYLVLDVAGGAEVGEIWDVVDTDVEERSWAEGWRAVFREVVKEGIWQGC